MLSAIKMDCPSTCRWIPLGNTKPSTSTFASPLVKDSLIILKIKKIMVSRGEGVSLICENINFKRCALSFQLRKFENLFFQVTFRCGNPPSKSLQIDQCHNLLTHHCKRSSHCRENQNRQGTFAEHLRLCLATNILVRFFLEHKKMLNY